MESKINSKILKIKVKNNQIVHKNEVVAILESSANYLDILKLKSFLDSINTNYQTIYFPLNKFKNLQLGEVQSSFIAFQKIYIDYEINQKLKPYSHEISSGISLQNENKNRLISLLTQQKLEQSKLELSNKQYQRSLYLFNQGIIPANDLEKEKIIFLQAKQNYDQMIVNISNERNTINATQKQIKSTEIIQEKTNLTNLNSVYQSINDLKKEIHIWEQTYLFIASCDGIIRFQNLWKENSYIKINDIFATILPKNQNQFIGNLSVSSQNSGKIKIGQKVLIQLDNFPFQEYGMIQGKINTSSLIQDKNGNYFITVNLPYKLKTTYKKSLIFDKELSGNAEIITEDLRLIERIFYQFRKLIKDKYL